MRPPGMWDSGLPYPAKTAIAEPDLTFGKAFELAQALESADRDAKTLLAVPPSVHAVTIWHAICFKVTLLIT